MTTATPTKIEVERDADKLAELIARHYGIETDSDYASEDEPETWETIIETRPIEPDGFIESLIQLFRKTWAYAELYVGWFLAFIEGFSTYRERLFHFNKAIWRIHYRKFLRAMKSITTEEVETQRKVEAQEIDPDHEPLSEMKSKTNRILAFGRGSITLNALKTDGATLLTGPSALMESKDISYPTLSESSEAFQAFDEHKNSLQQIPWVLDGPADLFPIPDEDEPYYENGHVPLRGLEQEFMQHCSLMHDVFTERDSMLINISAITEPAVYAAMTSVSNNGQVGTSNPLEVFHAYDDAPNGGKEVVELAKSWTNFSRTIIDALTRARLFSIEDQIQLECTDYGMFSRYSAFNFYCPDCNESKTLELLNRDYSVHNDQIYEPITFSDNSRCLFDPDEEVWICITCETRTTDPIPMHRMLDEILLPTYDFLMNEHKVERIRAHQSIRNREIEMKNDLEGVTDKAFFDMLDQLDRLREEIERLQVEAEGEQETMKEFEDIVQYYKIEQTGVLAGIEESAERINQNIADNTNQVIADVDAFKDAEQDQLENEMEGLSKAQRSDDKNRDEIQRQISENTGNTAKHQEKLANEAKKSRKQEERRAKRENRYNKQSLKQQVSHNRKSRKLQKRHTDTLAKVFS